MNINNLFKTPEGYIYSNRALLALFIPLLIEYGLEFFVGLADSIMVASLGEAAISGVSLVDFLVQLLIFNFTDQVFERDKHCFNNETLLSRSFSVYG